MANGTTPPGWYQDPTGQGDARYWNGTSWTEAVDQGGQTANVPIDPAQAQQPPPPGTQVQLPAPATEYNVQQSSSGSSMGAIIGVIVVLVLVVVVFVVIANNGSSDDSPTPGTEVVPATEAPAPATDAPAGDG